MSYRVGSGIDFHQLKDGRDLWIGGIKVPHSKGALGHSDADVLLHAICDALLGALCLGDIGVHFPNTDAAYKNIESITEVSKNDVSVKATTTEKMGFVGRKEGIIAYATVLLKKI